MPRRSLSSSSRPGGQSASQLRLSADPSRKPQPQLGKQVLNVGCTQALFKRAKRFAQLAGDQVADLVEPSHPDTILRALGRLTCQLAVLKERKVDAACGSKPVLLPQAWIELDQLPRPIAIIALELD